ADREALLREIPVNGEASFLAFSSDGRRLIANCELPVKNRKPGPTHELTVWDMTTQQTTTPVVRIANETNPTPVSKDARFAELGDARGGAVYDLATGQRQASINSSGFMRHNSFSPDGEATAAACEDFPSNLVRVWNSRTGELLWERDHAGWVLTVDFSPDGGRLVSASYDGTARIWNAKTGEPLLVIAHRAPLNGPY